MPVGSVVQPRQKRSKVLLRQTVAPKPITTKKRSARKNLPHTMMVAMAAIVFLVGIGVSLSTWKTNRTVVAQVQSLATEQPADPEANGGPDAQAGDVPDESDVSETQVRNYSTMPDSPRYIRIPSIKVNARVKTLGTKADNELAAPASIHDAGWFKDSSKPGTAGAMLIDGHVSGPTKPGVFKELKSTKPGDIIEVERGDGQIFKYRIVRSAWYDADKVDMAAALTPVTAGRPGLNLITCGGRFNASENNYEQRLVVFAEQL